MAEEKCNHEFTHVSNREYMTNQYHKNWKASRVTVYCKKCGKVTLDRIENNSGV